MDPIKNVSNLGDLYILYHQGNMFAAFSDY